MLNQDPSVLALIECLKNDISDQSGITHFFERIKKEGPVHAELLAALQTAVQNGDHQHPIFSNRHCSLYLLYLVVNHELPFWQGMNVYAYCIALMQFTDKQPMHVVDEEYKTHRSVSVARLMEGGQLTPEGEHYLNNIEKRYNDFISSRVISLQFNREKLLEAVADLSPADQWLITVDGFLDEKLQDFHGAKQKLVDDVLLYVADSGVTHHFTVPSVALMNVFHGLQSEKPMRFLPVIGTVSEDRYISMHQNNYHPLPLYSPFSNSNLLSVHALKCGPYLAWLHDVAHGFMANLISYDERCKLVSSIALSIRKQKDLEGIHRKDKFQEQVLKIYRELCDLNLAAIRDLPRARADWVMHHVVAAFGRHIGPKGLQIGLYVDRTLYKDTDKWDQVQDDLFYMLCHMKQLYRTTQDGKFWNELYGRIREAAVDRRNPKVIELIEKTVRGEKPTRAKCRLFQEPQEPSAPSLVQVPSGNQFR